MRLTRLVAVGSIFFAAGALGAQQPGAPAAKSGVATRDSAKALKHDAQRKRVQAKAAKAAGDTAKARELKKAAKSEAKQAKKMRKPSAAKAGAPAKRP